jgi:hypothetical protein
VQQPQTCFACHGDTNTVLVAATLQEHSRHASGRTSTRTTAPASAATRAKVRGPGDGDDGTRGDRGRDPDPLLHLSRAA